MPRRPDVAHRIALARAALDVLRTRGLQTSMRELADALGIKRPTLYFYFRDVGAVFETVLDPLLQAWQASIDAVLNRAREREHPIDRLRAVIDAALAFDRDHPQLIAALLQRWAAGEPDAAIALDRERRRLLAVREALVADLRTGIARKEVKSCDAERVVDLLFACVAGGIAHRMVGISRSDPAIRELADRMLETLRMQRRRKRARP